MRSQQIQTLLGAVSRMSVVAGVAGSLLAASMYTVDGGERAVIFDRLQGVKKEIKGEGTHLLLPIMQKPIIFQVRTRFLFSKLLCSTSLQPGFVRLVRKNKSCCC
jgi:prohibitin 1